MDFKIQQQFYKKGANSQVSEKERDMPKTIITADR